MKKILKQTEQIFAHAVALGQSGRLRSSIFAIEDEVLIFGSDHTTLIRCEIPDGQTPFDTPISFTASDYDSPKFGIEDGRVVFLKNAGGFKRKKISGIPDFTPEDIQALFRRFEVDDTNEFQIHADVLGLLDENLSHVEILAEDGDLLLRQRNVYDGTLIEISREKEIGFGVGTPDTIAEDFGPFGVRTDSILALFAFNDLITFSCGSGVPNYIHARGDRFGMEAIITACIYDELGETSVVESKPVKKKKGRTKAPAKKKGGRTRGRKE